MPINKTLAKERGISQEDQDKIEELHKLLENLIDVALEEGYPNKEEVSELIHRTENMLQALWNLPCDRKYHTWAKNYEFKSKWVGRKFECTSTKEVFEVPSSVERQDFFNIGKGFLDVGTDHYFRASGVVEVFE